MKDTLMSRADAGTNSGPIARIRVNLNGCLAVFHRRYSITVNPNRSSDVLWGDLFRSEDIYGIYTLIRIMKKNLDTGRRDAGDECGDYGVVGGVA